MDTTKEDTRPTPPVATAAPAWLSYTRSGDRGETSRGNRTRADKSDRWVTAYGDCEEAAAFLGYAIHSGTGLSPEKVRLLTRIQNDLIDVAADLASPLSPEDASSLRITDDYIDRLERACDHFAPGLHTPEGFVVPGGTVTASLLHYGHALVRRAERSAVAVLRHEPAGVNPLTTVYLNRLANLLLLLARVANADLGDTPWEPGLTSRLDGVELWEPLPGEFDPA